MTRLLDTNIVLYFLSGRLSRSLPDDDWAVSVITEIELLSYPRLDKKTEKHIRDFLSELTVVDLRADIKEKTIKLRKEFSLKLPDAIIAATAVMLDAELLSNDKRFSKIPGLRCKQLSLSNA